MGSNKRSALKVLVGAMASLCLFPPVLVIWVFLTVLAVGARVLIFAFSVLEAVCLALQELTIHKATEITKDLRLWAGVDNKKEEERAIG
jgi:cobalamin biosynthesis protein CobD/CbiB